MTNQHEEEKRTAGGSHEEPDLRSVMRGETRRRVISPEEREQKLDQDRTSLRQKPEPPPMKLPPVWPGDEKQEWFRKERGLPPMYERDAAPPLDPEDLPTDLADIPTRGRAYGVGVLLPNVIGLIPTIGFFVGLIALAANIVLYRQGQDIGCAIFRLRVVRENGDVAGFFHMWVRSAASIISLLALGAGFWSAFSDPHFRTWHDKWLGTYVVKDAPEYKTSRRSSSDTAKKWFWVTLFLFIAFGLMTVLASAPMPETTQAG